jgi:hypothetical protein
VEPLARQKNLTLEKQVAFRERELGSYSPVTFNEAVSMTWEDPHFAHPFYIGRNRIVIQG